jgi:hypothetical protein
MQSEEAKKDFLLQQKIDREYRQLLFSSALQSEVATEEANKAYQTLVSLNPEFGKLDKNKLFYSVSLGDVSVDAQGEVQINSKFSGKLELDAQAKKDAKFQEQLDLAIEAFRNLPAADQTKYAIAIDNLQQSLGVKSAADAAFAELRKNPDKRQFYVEAQRLLKGQKKQQIADESAEQAIQNALTPEELEAGVPASASPELIIKAKTKYKELKKQVKEAQKEFTKMNYNELSQLDADEIESTNPVRAQALRYEMQEREIKRKLDEHNEIRAAIIPYMAAQDDANALAFEEAQQEAIENFVKELATITSDIAVVDSNGRQFVIQGRVYEVRPNALDSLEFDETFSLTGVTLIDVKTGREKRFNISIDFSNQEEVLQGVVQEKSGEDIIPEAIAHSILMNAMAIDEVNDTVDSALTATENTRVTILSEALDAIEKEKAKKTNTDLKDSDKSIGTLKTERRRLKMINDKLLSMLDALDKAKNSERLSQDEFEAIPKIKDIIDTLTALGEVIDAKSSVIESKQLGGDVTEPDFSTNEEEDNILIQEEQDAIATLTNQLNTFAEAQQANQDILEAAANNLGYQGFTETDLANMRMEARRLKDLVNELNAKIESHRKNINIIKQLQDEVRIAELQQAGEAALGSGVSTQGEIAQGEDTSINTGTPQERPDQSEEIRAEEEKRKAQAAQEELDKIKNTTDSTELKSEPTKPVPTQVQPQTEPAAPVVTVSSNTLNLPLAQIEVQKPDVESSQVIVAEDGTVLSGNMVVQMDANNNPILIFSENISDPNNTVRIGDDVEFVVDETTQWWQENKDKYPVDEHWMHVPIFIKHNGVNIALLAAAKDKNQTDRKLIFDNKNGKPTATVKGKLISDSNISNAVTENGTKVFYDPTQLIQQGGIGIVTTKGVTPFFGEFTEEELVAISQIQSDSLLKGQVIIIGKDPLGRPKAFVASTKSMDEYGLTAILNSIKEGAFENVSQILGTNLILDEFIAAEQESYDDIKNNNIKNIVYLEVLGSGELLFTFYSESAKSLIRISASNIQTALNSENDSNIEFSFVDFKQSEKEGVEGYDVVISERKDHKSFKKEIMNEFRTAVLKKKYQVSKDLLSQEGKYVSKITGIEYDSYVDYLASSQEFSEPRTEGLGHNSILSTDIALSASGSAFNNIGLDLGNLKIQDQIVPTTTQVERNAVKISEPTETTPEVGEIDVASTPADDLFAEFGVEETTPTAPVSTNTKGDIESKTKEELFPIDSLHKGKESGDILKVIGYTKDGVRFEIQTEGNLKPTKNVIISELKRLITEGKLAALSKDTTDAKVDVKKDRYYYSPVNRMVRVQKDSENTPITKEEEEEIEAVIEKAKELGWDKDRLFRQLSSMGYSYAFGVQPEGYRNYLEDRLSGKTNIKVTSEFNFFEQLDKELAALENTTQPVSQPAVSPNTKTTGDTLGFSNLSNIGNQGLAIMDADINKSGKHVISSISRATPEQRQKIDSNIEELKKKYPQKNIVSRIENNNIIVEVISTPQPAALSFEERLLSGARQSTITPEQQQILEAELAQQQGSITNLADLMKEGDDIQNACK